jgi:hypothetical protein
VTELEQERDEAFELLQLTHRCPEEDAPNVFRCLKDNPRDNPRDINELTRTVKAVLAPKKFSKVELSTQPQHE